MATTLTYRGKVMLGPGILADYGDYSTDGTTTATITLSGGYPISLTFYDASNNLCASAGTGSTASLSAKTLAAGTSYTTWTLTPGGSAITGGNFLFIHGGA
jgi:hypothetical protein